MFNLPYLLCTLGLWLSLYLAQPVQAQSTATTDPITQTTQVTATVPDNIPPTTPILISPTDGSYVTSGYVTFVWQGSNDDNGIGRYELSIDGSHYLNLPPHDNEQNDYSLSYDVNTDRYTLQIKNLIPDGTHTWKIRAIDTLNNGTDSTTWSFILDTQAPSFILTQVGDVTTSISAQDSRTVPTQPLVLTKNSPQLLGHGEADSTVVLTLNLPNNQSQTFSHTTDINGNWGELLGILPRDVILYLDFTITDPAGHISILSNVPFTIPTQYFIFPPSSPPASPTPPAIGGVMPTPSTSPPSRPGGQHPPHTPVLIAIPMTPAIEIAHQIVTASVDSLPPPLRQLLYRIPPQTRSQIVAHSLHLAPILLLVIELIVGLIASLSILHRFGRQVSPHLFWLAWQKLELFPTGKAWLIFNKSYTPQGFVFDSLTHQGVAFTQVEIRNKQPTAVVQVLTDQDGFFGGITLQAGKYQLWVNHPHYQFPSQQPRPSNPNTTGYYYGEIFVVGERNAGGQKFVVGEKNANDRGDKAVDISNPVTNQLRWLIPVDLTTPEQKRWSWFISLADFKRLHAHLFWPLAIFDLIIVLIFPSPWNIAVLATYIYQAGYGMASWF